MVGPWLGGNGKRREVKKKGRKVRKRFIGRNNRVSIRGGPGMARVSEGVSCCQGRKNNPGKRRDLEEVPGGVAQENLARPKKSRKT